jgi:hypothetical protein
MDPSLFGQNGPMAFILAADGAFTPYHPENDQVWELEFGQHEIHPFCIQTTYGLRAKSMRLFPSFVINYRRYTNADSFLTPPFITQYTPDSIQVQSEAVLGCEIHFDVFVPASDTLVGGVEVFNKGKEYLSLNLELAAVLAPMPDGIATRPDQNGINQIISGKTGNLYPVLFMTGGPSAVSSPYPALSIPIRLSPLQSRRLTWALVTKDSRETSLDTARKVTATPWRETVQMRVMQQASRSIQIRTGNKAWDQAFSFTQVQAQIHWIATEHPSKSLFLRSRVPDDGITNHHEQSHLDDLTLLEAVHLGQVLLPAWKEQYSILLRNLLSRQTDTGEIFSPLNTVAYSKPFHDCPLLAQLFLLLYEIDGSETQLADVFPALCKYIDSWLPEGYDPEKDQTPALKDPRQLQLDSGLFNFDIWEDSGQGVDIRFVESPALLAMLLQETTALSQMAEILGDKSSKTKYKSLSKTLLIQAQAAWDESLSMFTYRDIESHERPSSELYCSGNAQKELKVGKTFLQPQRLQLHLIAKDEHTRVCIIRFNGKDLTGEPLRETIKSSQIRWVLGKAHLTTRNLFKSIQTISIEGLKTNDQYSLETIDFSQPDITCLLPILTGTVKENRITVLLEKYFNPSEERTNFGIPEIWQVIHELPQDLVIQSNVLWNTFIIQGLARSGFKDQAATLFTNLMSAIISGLKYYGGFFPFYNIRDGRPAGTKNALSGLAPLNLFLELVGIRLFSPSKIAIWGQNPFPWPVEIHWQGLSIQRDGAHTDLTFPDGSKYSGNNEKPLVITQESSMR